MRKFIPPVAAVLLALACVVPARAEKWLWYPIKGGAVAYDQDSRKTDAAEGRVGARTLIFYEQARKVDGEEFNFVAERLEFECRSDRQRWSQSAVLDLKGYVVRARPDSDWVKMGAELGSAAMFKRMLCLGDAPPGGREAADLDTVLLALGGTGAKSKGGPDLRDLAFVAPRVIPPPAAAAPPPVAKVEPPAPKVEPPAPKAAPPPAAAIAAPTVLAAAPKAVAEPRIVVETKTPPPPSLALPTIAQTTYATAPRCVEFKRQGNLTYTAANDCTYRVNYAWCVAGGADPGVECGAPFVARVSSAVPAKSQAPSAYLGGVGRMHLFACRAPGTPMVRGEAGRYEYECLGPAAAAPEAQQPQARAPVPKSSPPAPKEPQLRRLSQ